MERRRFLHLMALAGTISTTPWVERGGLAASGADAFQLDRELVDSLETLQRGLWLRWHLAPAPELYSHLQGLGAILANLADRGPMYRSDVERLCSFNSAMLGLLARTLGDDAAAATHLTVARHYAQDAADSSLLALALLWGSDVRSAVQLGVPGPSPAEVVEMLREAEQLTMGGPTSLRAYVLFRLAEELAAAGMAWPADRALDRAGETLVYPDGQGLFGRPWPERVNEAFRGNVALLEGLPRLAAAVLAPVVNALPAGQVTSDGIAATADLAAALARLDQPEEACRLLGDSWEQAHAARMAEREVRILNIRKRELADRVHERFVIQLDERAGWSVV